MADTPQRRTPFGKGPSTKDVMNSYRGRDKGKISVTTELQKHSDTEKIKATFLLPSSLHQELKLHAVQNGQKFSAVVEVALIDYLKKHQKKTG